MQIIKYVIFFLLGIGVFSNGLAQKVSEFSPASDDMISYSGRVRINGKTAEFNWPGVSISTVFSGKSVGIKIFGGESNYFNVWIDNHPAWVLHAPVDSVYYYPNKLKAGKHKLKIVKRTEADMGMAYFYGLFTKKKLKAPEQQNKRKIMVIGNSITCGYGTEGKNKDERFSPATENCEQSYATILGRYFEADYQLVAHSGLGVVRNYGDSLKVSRRLKPMPSRLDYLFDNDSTRKWDMQAFIPNAILINLGTNDFSTQPHPDEKVFIDTYVDLIKQLKELYPKAKIFCISGPMIGEPCTGYVRSVVEQSSGEEENVFFIEIPGGILNQTDDLGSDWHPSYKGQIKVTTHIIKNISFVMNWNYSEKGVVR